MGEEHRRGAWPIAAGEPVRRPRPAVPVVVLNQGVEAGMREHELRASFPYSLEPLDLGTAGVDEEVKFRGTSVTMLQASTPGAELTVRARGKGSDPVPMRRGDTWRIHFDKLYLDWALQAGATAYLLLEYDVP